MRCLGCGERTPRELLDRRLREANPGWSARAGAVNPDGDVELFDEEITSFRVVDCASCGGVLKPDVVFFGENVPRDRVAACLELVERAGLVLVLGSSLAVMSGYRLVRHAADRGIPIAIINQGPTRGDAHALVTIDARLGSALPQLLARLDAGW